MNVDDTNARKSLLYLLCNIPGDAKDIYRTSDELSKLLIKSDGGYRYKKHKDKSGGGSWGWCVFGGGRLLLLLLLLPLLL